MFSEVDVSRSVFNVFISQPMRGLSDQEILSAKESAIEKVTDYVLRKYGHNIKVIDTFFPDFDGNRLKFLGKSILDGLSKADLAVFLPGWNKADGCRCEEFIAVRYGVECLYITE